MSAWADGLLRTSIQGGIAVLILFALFRLFPRIPGNVQVWMWRAIALKFLLGMILPVTIWTSTWQVAGYLPDDPLPEIIFGASAIGLLLAALALFRDWRVVKRLERGGVPVQLSILEELCQRVQVDQEPNVLLRTDLDRPILTGATRPTIHLPSGLSEQAQTMVISHELAHIKRRDLAWEWLFVALEGIFFFHPLVWLMRKEHRMAQENACDELALQTSRTSLAQYGRMLLDLTVACKRKELSLSANMAGTYATLHARIVRLHRGSRRVGAVALSILLLVTFGLIPTWRTEFRADMTGSPVQLAPTPTPVAHFGVASLTGRASTPKEGNI